MLTKTDTDISSGISYIYTYSGNIGERTLSRIAGEFSGLAEMPIPKPVFVAKELCIPCRSGSDATPFIGGGGGK